MSSLIIEITVSIFFVRTSQGSSIFDQEENSTQVRVGELCYGRTCDWKAADPLDRTLDPYFPLGLTNRHYYPCDPPLLTPLRGNP